MIIQETIQQYRYDWNTINKNKGPRMLPWGTPLSICIGMNVLSFANKPMSKYCSTKLENKWSYFSILLFVKDLSRLFVSYQLSICYLLLLQYLKINNMNI